LTTRTSWSQTRLRSFFGNLEEGMKMKKPTKAVLRPFEVREIKREDKIT
jgi:hypothetical protein